MKSITMFVDGRANDKESLRAAVAFCRFIDGRLTVMYAPHDLTIVASDAQGIVVDEGDESAARESARAAYDEVCGALRYCEWRSTSQSKTRAIINQGLLSDVTVLERVTSEEGPEALALNTALFETPGPVLVTPPGASSKIGEAVAVAWSPSVQSARVLRSAIPILTRAKSVTVIVNGTDDRVDLSALTGYLQLHGIKSSLRRFDGTGMTARGRGRAILAAATAIPADLLVMGAFGENRFTALLGLGRATRKVITASNIPVLVQR